jgi:hypothetical protein
MAGGDGLATTVDVTTLEFTPEMAAACRRAGRNQPCPHGSGRKVKFCPCPVLHPRQAAAVPWDVEKTVGEDMAVFLLAARFNDVLPNAWESFTDGDTWPGSMQALFTTKDHFTVARFVDWFIRSFPMPRYNNRTPAQLFAQERADRIGPAGRRVATAYIESVPALMEVTAYTANERLMVRDLLTNEEHEVALTPDMELPDDLAPGWVLYTFVHTLNDVWRMSTAGLAIKPAGGEQMIAAVREAVGAQPDAAKLRETYPALISRGVAIQEELEKAEAPKWVHAVYTAEDPNAVVEQLTADEDFTVYEAKEVLPRSASPFSWPLPAGEEGERFVAVGAGRVVLAASSPALLASSREALEQKLGDRATFLTESDEPTVILLRRSWQPKSADSSAGATSEASDAAEKQNREGAEGTQA